MQIMTIYMVKIQCKLQDQFCDIETFTPILLEGCLYSLDWTTGLTFELTFELCRSGSDKVRSSQDSVKSFIKIIYPEDNTNF